MDNENLNSTDTNMPVERTRNIAFLGTGFVAICLLFTAAFIGFRPDQASLSDRYFPSPTIIPSRTPTPTSTPNWIATQKVIGATATAYGIQTTIAIVENDWNILFIDNFDTNTNQWEIGNHENNLATLDRTIEDGQYNWEAKSKSGFVWYAIADTESLQDFFLSATAERKQGHVLSEYGLVFRKISNDNYYYFRILTNSYSVSVHYNGEWKDIVDETPSPAIRITGPNRLTVIAKGTHYIFMINDQVVADMTDNRILTGKAGIAIAIPRPDLKSSFAFDDIEIREP